MTLRYSVYQAHFKRMIFFKNLWTSSEWDEYQTNLHYGKFSKGKTVGNYNWGDLFANDGKSYLMKAWLMAKLQVTTEEHPLTRKRHRINEEIPLREIDIVYLEHNRQMNVKLFLLEQRNFK